MHQLFAIDTKNYEFSTTDGTQGKHLLHLQDSAAQDSHN